MQLIRESASLQTHHVDSTLKRRGNDRSFPRRFNVESTWCVCRAVAKTKKKTTKNNINKNQKKNKENIVNQI